MINFRHGVTALLVAVVGLGATGCAAGTGASPETTSSVVTSPAESTAQSTLSGELLVYSGAGLKKPMEMIKTEFEAANPGVTINYTYGGSAQLLAQMESSGKGDVFIPGSQDSYQTAKDKGLANEEHLIAHHTPAIAVVKGNPHGIATLEDFTKPGIRVVLGDEKANAIGMTAQKLFEKNNITGVDANVVARTATVNEIFTALEAGNGDAAIVTVDGFRGHEAALEMVEIAPESNIDQIIPICSLTTAASPELAQEFVDYVASGAGRGAFEKAGYQLYQG